MHKLFTSCIWRCPVSRACGWVMSALSAALLIFSFQFSLLSFHISVARPHQHCGGFDTPYRTSDVTDNLGRYVSCMERTFQRKDFESISTVKMETRHLVEGRFGSEFSVICNHCGVMTAWSRKNGKFCVQFLHFSFEKKRPVHFGRIKTVLYEQLYSPWEVA